jgi:hypothetical protein
MVIKENFSRDLADKLLNDIMFVISHLQKTPPCTEPVNTSGKTICSATPHGPC